MGCLYLEIEDQSCLADSVDQCLMKNRQIDLLDSMTKNKPEKCSSHFFPILVLSGIVQQITPLNKVWKISAILSAFHCNRSIDGLNVSFLFL